MVSDFFEPIFEDVDIEDGKEVEEAEETERYGENFYKKVSCAVT